MADSPTSDPKDGERPPKKKRSLVAPLAWILGGGALAGAGATMLSPDLRKALSNFSNGATRWATGHDPARAAQEYVQTGSDAMRGKFWGVLPARKVIEGLRRLPFLDPKDSWNPGAEAHYDAFAKGPLSAYNQLVKERMADVPLKGIKKFLTKGYEERLRDQVDELKGLGEQRGFEALNKESPLSSPIFTMQKHLVDSHLGQVTSGDWGPRYRDHIIKPLEMMPWAIGAAGAGAAGVGVGELLRSDLSDDEEDKQATFALPGALRNAWAAAKPLVQGARTVLPQVIKSPDLRANLGVHVLDPMKKDILSAFKNDIERGGALALNTARGSGIMKSHVLPGMGQGFVGGAAGDVALQGMTGREEFSPMEAISAGLLGGVGFGGAKGIHGLKPRYKQVKDLYNAGITQEGYGTVHKLLGNLAFGGEGSRMQALKSIPGAIKGMRSPVHKGWEVGILSNEGAKGTVGQVAMRALQQVGAKELGTGAIINPGVALAMSNPRIVKSLARHGINRLHGSAKAKTLSRVTPAEIADHERIRKIYFPRRREWSPNSGTYDERMEDLENLLKSDRFGVNRRQRILDILSENDHNVLDGSSTRAIFQGAKPFRFDIDPRKGNGVPFDFAQ